MTFFNFLIGKEDFFKLEVGLLTTGPETLNLQQAMPKGKPIARVEPATV